MPNNKAKQQTANNAAPKLMYQIPILAVHQLV